MAHWHRKSLRVRRPFAVGILQQFASLLRFLVELASPSHNKSRNFV